MTALEHLFDLHVDLAEPVPLREGPDGRHWFIPIVGGRVTGGLTGTILPGGGDWARERGDGCWDLDARYQLRLDDGTVVEVRNRGYYVEGTVDGEAGPAYYLTAPELLPPPDGPHAWLGRTVLVGEAFELDAEHIRIEVHAVRH